MVDNYHWSLGTVHRPCFLLLGTQSLVSNRWKHVFSRPGTSDFRRIFLKKITILQLWSIISVYVLNPIINIDKPSPMLSFLWIVDIIPKRQLLTALALPHHNTQISCLAIPLLTSWSNLFFLVKKNGFPVARWKRMLTVPLLEVGNLSFSFGGSLSLRNRLQTLTKTNDLWCLNMFFCHLYTDTLIG